MDLTVLNLSGNLVTSLSPLTFDGLITGSLDLTYNRILTVMHLAWNGSALGNLTMWGNPTECGFPVTGDANILCRCGSLHDTSAVTPTSTPFRTTPRATTASRRTTTSTTTSSTSSSTTASPLRSHSGLREACIFCSSTLVVDDIYLINLFTESTTTRSSTTTPPLHTATFSAQPTPAPTRRASTTTPGTTQAANVTEVVGSLNFDCPGGGVLGDVCTVSCRDGFEGQATPFVCSSAGEWELPPNTSDVACVSFPYVEPKKCTL